MVATVTLVLQRLKVYKTKEVTPICKITLGPAIIPAIIILVLIALDIDGYRGFWSQKQLVAIFALEMCFFYVPVSIWLAGWFLTMYRLKSLYPQNERLVFRLIMWGTLLLVIPVHLALFVMCLIPGSNPHGLSSLMIAGFSTEMIVASIGLAVGSICAVITINSLASSVTNEWTKTILKAKVVFFGLTFLVLLILFSLALGSDLAPDFAAQTRKIPSWAFWLLCGSLCAFWFCALVLFLDSYYLIGEALHLLRFHEAMTPKKVQCIMSPTKV